MLRHLTASLLLLGVLAQATASPGCLSDTEGVCTACDTSQLYYLQYGACQKFQGLHCTQIDADGKCLACDSGFLLSQNGACVYVQDRVLNCAEYSETNGHLLCTACNPGFILARLLCLPATPHCKTYYPGRNRCQVCDDGYQLDHTLISCESVLAKTSTN